MRFVYDGGQCIAEMNGTNNTVFRSYVWRTDLSGSQTGAGGVGGLVMMSSVQNGTHFFAYDGNGNVSALVNASNGEVSANYEYGPFGELIRVSGTMSRENPYRFSTKLTVDSIDIILYEYRPYSPTIGRWLSRDLIGKESPNIYLNGNNGLYSVSSINGRAVILPRPIPIPQPSPTQPAPLSYPFPIPVPSSQSPDDIKNPTLSWESEGSEINQIQSGNEVQARGSCLTLATKSPRVNQYYYASASYGRAMGAAAVLWEAKEGENARYIPPDYRAAFAKTPRKVHKGHLIPREFGGKDGEQNIVTQEASYNSPYFLNLINVQIRRLLKKRTCNCVCLVVRPRYATGKPVPSAFSIIIVDRFDFFFYKTDSQPSIYGDLNFEMTPWHGTSRDELLNGNVMQSGF